MTSRQGGKSRRVPIPQRQRFDRSRTAVGEARAFLRNAVQGRTGPEVEDELVLALSELASNAVLHAGTGFEVTVDAAESIRIEVEDGSTRTPELRPLSPDAPGGRGMHIVARLCDRWGVEVRRDRKCVWCERDLH